MRPVSLTRQRYGAIEGRPTGPAMLSERSVAVMDCPDYVHRRNVYVLAWYATMKDLYFAIRRSQNLKGCRKRRRSIRRQRRVSAGVESLGAVTFSGPAPPAMADGLCKEDKPAAFEVRAPAPEARSGVLDMVPSS